MDYCQYLENLCAQAHACYHVCIRHRGLLKMRKLKFLQWQWAVKMSCGHDFFDLHSRVGCRIWLMEAAFGRREVGTHSPSLLLYQYIALVWVPFCSKRCHGYFLAAITSWLCKRVPRAIVAIGQLCRGAPVQLLATAMRRRPHRHAQTTRDY